MLWLFPDMIQALPGSPDFNQSSNVSPRRSPRLKVFVQNKRTALFFAYDNVWDVRAQRAHNFKHIHEAVDFCRRYNLQSAQVVIRTKNPSFNIAFGVPSVKQRTVQTRGIGRRLSVKSIRCLVARPHQVALNRIEQGPVVCKTLRGERL